MVDQLVGSLYGRWSAPAESVTNSVVNDVGSERQVTKARNGWLEVFHFGSSVLLARANRCLAAFAADRSEFQALHKRADVRSAI